MELAYYDVTFRSEPYASHTKSGVYCHGEYEAIAKIKEQYPNAVIIEVKKR
ncbi:MAG: hypothetical protein IKJ91_01225 [Clostridia bacterium]|nr:hypothetical protein [Clostridia bacterium]